MKIIAIRGENLASLARPFDIPLSEGALAQSGLFAITGPTGSGKSTLLDALCLALYDQTPRYTTGRQGAAVGQKDGDDALWIKSNDVRQILSRGKTSGWAEVDFIGVDGQLYRARWSVRRARNRLDGRLQNQELSLTHLGGANGQEKIESGKKTEVLASIEQKIGLSWDQFRRAVLLPQGDFAAFLKASPKARSELLERLTGTEIYSKIGMAAFEKGKQEEQHLAELIKKRGALMLLDDAALAELTAELTATNAQLQRGQNLVSEADKPQALAQQCTELQNKMTQAQGKLEQLEQQQSQFDALAAQLAVFDQAQTARPLYQQRSRLDIALAELEPKLARAQQQSEQLEQRQHTLQQQLSALTETHRQSSAAWQQWQMDKAQAEQWHTQQQQLTEQQRQLNAQINPLQIEQTQAEQHLQQLEQQSAELHAEQHQLTQLFAANHALGALSGQWSQWRARLLQLGQDSQQWQKLGQQQNQFAPQLARMSQQLVQWTARTEQLRRDESLLSQQLGELTAHEPAKIDSQQFAQQEQQWRTLTQVFALKKQLGPVQQRQAQLTAELNQLQAQTAQWQHDQTELTQRLAHNQSAYQEAKWQFEQAQATLGLEQYRHLLREQQPCPLCGGLEHPYQQQQPAVNALLQQIQQRVFQLEQQIQQDQTALHRGQAWEENSSKQHDAWRRESHELGLMITEAEQQITQALQPHPDWQQHCEAELAQALAKLEHTLQQGRQQQQLWQRWQEQHRQQQYALEQLRQALNQAQTEQHQHQLVLQQQQEQAKQQQQEMQRLEQQIHTEQAQLTQLLPDLPWSQLLGTPEQFPQAVAELEQILAELSQYKVRAEQVSQALIESEKQQQHQQATRQQVQASLALLVPQLEQLTAQLQPLQHKLTALLQGETLSERDQRLEQHWQQAQSALAQTQQQLSECQTEQAAARSTLAQLTAQQIEQQTERRECIGLWGDLLQRLDLAEQSILALMDKDHLWRQQQQQVLSEHQLQLGSARQAIVQTQNELTERTAEQQQATEQWQQQLEQSDFSAGDLAELKTHLTLLGEQQFELRRQLVEQENLRTQDAELLAQSQQAEQACKVWLELKEIIGSADGSRFRAMAQALTLAQLLGLANVQLIELAPRYRLQPTPGNGLDLQVIDADMGEEIRAIESLSGGETFLVSLALALALSALTTGGGCIASLFIDEGFGTLDPDSLELALSCLDALQAAGRQVGVISHVQTLVERIGTRVQLMAAGGGNSQLQIINR